MNGRKPTRREYDGLFTAVRADYAERSRLHPQHRLGTVPPSAECPMCREQGMAVKSSGQDLWENYGFYILFGLGIIAFVIWFAAGSGHPL